MMCAHLMRTCMCTFVPEPRGARGPSQVLHELVGEALHVDHLLLVRRDDAQHVLDLRGPVRSSSSGKIRDDRITRSKPSKVLIGSAVATSYHHIHGDY